MVETPISLLERLRLSPDEGSWQRLVALYTPLIQTWLHRHDLPAADRDDLTQEIMQVLLRELPHYQHDQRAGAFRRWLRGVTVNRLRVFWRGRHLSTDTPLPVAGTVSVEVPAELVEHPRYHIQSTLGAGGMGVVFKAEHRLMERTVVLKVIHKNLLERRELVERFRQEVKAAARLSHPNIAAAYDAEQAGGLHFLVMEYIEGMSLDRVVQARGRLPATLAADIARQAALGLQHAHERGMIHRDIKPQNLLLTPGGQVKILDFGLARLSRDGEGGVTPPGVIIGTPDYLAPEQAMDACQADTRADVYSLGCTLYFLLAGRPPFLEGSVLQKLLAHQERTPPALAALRPEIAPGLARIVEQMMAKDLGQRIQTAAEAAERLAPFAADDASGHAALVVSRGSEKGPASAVRGKTRIRSSRRRLVFALAGAALLVCVLFGGYRSWRQRWGSRTGEAQVLPLPGENEPLADDTEGKVAGPVQPCFRAVLAKDGRHALLAGLDFHAYLWDLRGGAGSDSEINIALAKPTRRRSSSWWVTSRSKAPSRRTPSRLDSERIKARRPTKSLPGSSRSKK